LPPAVISIKRKTVLVVVACLGCFAALIFHLVRREPSIGDDAERIARSLINENSSDLSEHLQLYELQFMGWDREKAQRFLREYVLHKYDGVSLTRIVNKSITLYGESGWCEYEVQMQDGRRIRRWSHATQTDAHGKVLISELLQDAWCVEYFRDHPGVALIKLPLLAVKTGIVRDFAVLKSYGFRGFVKSNPTEKPTDLEVAYERALTFVKAHPGI
jgi:hypothetical protein